ncbi:hypothetical protein KFU94_49280 [Chloroflexi bacterium TSY]|nr:hypothetical protein [Chloroflexi bacterium TSY]
MSFIKKALIRLARKVLQGVLSQLTQQFNIVQEQAMNPMRQMIAAVTGGIWVGEGANAFVDEVSSLMIPGVGKVCDNITFVSDNLKFADEVMDRADDAVNGKANALGDVFDAIF